MVRGWQRALAGIALIAAFAARAADGDPPSASSAAASPASSQAPSAPAAASADDDAASAAKRAEEMQFRKELLSSESSVQVLKERAYSAKSILQAIRAMDLEDAVSAPRAVVWYDSELGRGYEIAGLHITLDGAKVLDTNNDSGQLRVKDVKVYDAALPPGSHVLEVTVDVKTAEESYPVASTQKFEVIPGQVTIIKAVTAEAGPGAGSKKPFLRYDVLNQPLKGQGS
jgi:hypothetical protein